MARDVSTSEPPARAACHCSPREQHTAALCVDPTLRDTAAPSLLARQPSEALADAEKLKAAH